MSIEFLSVNNQKIQEQLLQLINTEEKSAPEAIIEKFNQLLHADNDAFMQADYDSHSWELLDACIRSSNQEIASGIADLILETEVDLDYDDDALPLEEAALHGRIELYQAIKKKIIDNPKQYPKSYKELSKGKSLHYHLHVALNKCAERGIDFVLFLLKEHQDFYKQFDKKIKRLLFCKFGYPSILKTFFKCETLSH